MTTIVYKDGILAYDSRRTAGDVITRDDAQKCEEHDGVKYILCASVADYPDFRAAFMGKRLEHRIDVAGFVLQDGKLWQAGFDPGQGFWRCEVELDVPCAVGTGAPYAIAAMDMGANAVRAVEIAKGRDLYTGGPVRKIKVR